MTVVELSSPVALLVAFWGKPRCWLWIFVTASRVLPGLAPRHMIRSMFRCCNCLFASKSTALPKQQNLLDAMLETSSN